MAKKEWRDFRVESRNSYGVEITIDDDGRPTLPEGDFLQKGALLRIADALERLASGKTELETLKELQEVKKDRDYHSSRRMEEIAAKEKLYRRITALRGVITKLKKAK